MIKNKHLVQPAWSAAGTLTPAAYKNFNSCRCKVTGTPYSSARVIIIICIYDVMAFVYII